MSEGEKEPLPLDLSGRLLVEVFPFLLVLDSQLRLLGHGPRLAKVCKNLAIGAAFTELFSVSRPRGPVSLENFRRGAKSTFFLTSLTTQIRMRGQLLFDEANERLLFIGSPWFTELAELEKTELILSDFTIHDPIVDFLYLIRAQKIISEDLRRAGEEVARRRDELEATNQRLEEASRVKTQFLANTSHELRTPLNGIMGMAALLVRQPLSAQALRFAENILRSARSLLNVVNDVLDLSKIEAGKLTLSEAPFDLHRLLTELLDGHHIVAHNKGLECVCLLEPDLPQSVRGDAQRLRQILDNLLSNAIKFTKQGEISLAVRVVEQQGQSVSLRFEVRDTGIGIAKKDHPSLFQVFSQVDSSMSRSFGGTGLGLALCKQLVLLMGGECGVESELGQGSTFWFTARLSNNTRPEISQRFRPLLGQVNSLIVDDNTTNREYLGALLLQWGVQTEVADSGLRALELLRGGKSRGKPFDVVLVDQQMPGMTGLDLATILSADPDFQRVVIVLLSSGDPQAVREHPMGKRLHAVLPKPISPSSLLDCLTQLIDLKVGGEKPEASATSVPSAGPVPVPRHHGPAQILVVDDNAINIEVAVRMVEELGYGADAAAGGREALERAARHPYKLILMDLQMPEVDGYQATAAIRKREGTEKRTPIVAMTAHAMPEDRARALAGGFDDYLPKPVELEVLAACVLRWAGAPGGAGESAPASAQSDVAPRRLESRPPPIDAAVLANLRRLSRPGEPDFAQTVLGQFRQSLPGFAAELRVALSAGEAASVARLCHKLKSASGHVGATELSRLCAEAQKVNSGAQLQPIGDAVLLELTSVAAYVEEQLASAKT